jgi:hypothetical protein
MNERIKELAKQAGFAMEIDNDPNSPPGWWGAGHNPTFEKFAELIVRECLQVSLKNSHRDDDMGAIIARNIKQHFGVE